MAYIEGHMASIRQQLIFFYHFYTDEDFQEKVPFAEIVASKLFNRLVAKDYFSLIGKSYKQMKRKKPEDPFHDENLCVDETIKLIFQLHGKVYDHQITPAQEPHGWKVLAEVKKKRNQLTHPACASDLEVNHFAWHMGGILGRGRRRYEQRCLCDPAMKKGGGDEIKLHEQSRVRWGN